MHLITYGFLRVLCQNLGEYRLYKDLPIQGSYDLNFSEGGNVVGGIIKNFSTIGSSGAAGKNTTSQFKVYSFGILYKTINMLDTFLMHLNN